MKWVGNVGYVVGEISAVPEIKLLFCALAGWTFHKTVHLEIAPCTLPIYIINGTKNSRVWVKDVGIVSGCSGWEQ